MADDRSNDIQKPIFRHQELPTTAITNLDKTETNGASKASQVFASSGTRRKPVAHSVMLIEDETSTAVLMRRALESAGFLVFSTDNASDAVDMALGLVPDAIVMDIQLPNQDGWEILGALKNESEIASSQIIVCSANSDRARAESAGAADFVEKPFTPKGILEAIQRVGLQVHPTEAQAQTGD